MPTSRTNSPADAALGRFASMTAATGRIYFWQGLSLWIGQGTGTTQWHAHHAHQLTIALQGNFRFRTTQDGAWSDFDGALVPGHCTHQFQVDDASVAHLFVEPESRAGRILLARYGCATVSGLPTDAVLEAAAVLRAALQAGASSDRMGAATLTAIAAIAGATTEPDNKLDMRLERALQYIRANIRNPISMKDVASAVALSESRFRHLFVAETGSSFRAYLLWLRINLAIEAVMTGASWTAAAHEAGFADSAHLTRTHRRMFGIEPTAIRPSTMPPA